MKVKDLIKELEKLDGEKTIKTFSVDREGVFSDVGIEIFEKEVMDECFENHPYGLNGDYYI